MHHAGMALSLQNRVIALDAGALRWRMGAEADRRLRFSDESASRAWLRGHSQSPSTLRTLRAVAATLEPWRDLGRSDDADVIDAIARALARGRLGAVIGPR